MKEIFKQIDKWLQEAKDNQSRHAFTGPEAFHRGEVSAYTKVGVLLQRHLTSQSSGREYSCSCSAVKRIGVGKFCPDCGGRNSRR